MMQLKCLSGLALGLMLTSAVVAENRDPGEYFSDQSSGDFSEEMVNVREFMLLGQYVVEGVYRDTSFTRYKRDNRR